MTLLHLKSVQTTDLFLVNLNRTILVLCFFLQDKSLEKTNVKIDWNKFVDEDEEEGGGTIDSPVF